MVYTLEPHEIEQAVIDYMVKTQELDPDELANAIMKVRVNGYPGKFAFDSKEVKFHVVVK